MQTAYAPLLSIDRSDFAHADQWYAEGLGGCEELSK